MRQRHWLPVAGPCAAHGRPVNLGKITRRKRYNNESWQYSLFFFIGSSSLIISQISVFQILIVAPLDGFDEWRHGGIGTHQYVGVRLLSVHPGKVDMGGINSTLNLPNVEVFDQYLYEVCNGCDGNAID